MAAQDIRAEVSGRPKHLQHLEQDARQVHRFLRALRCARLPRHRRRRQDLLRGAGHRARYLDADPEEFDDYISRPKQNGYQSLHTVVMAEDGRALEVQIRTHEMHHFAEYGVAAHWRYKESGGSNFSAQKYDEKIAWLRQLLAWKNEVTDAVVDQEEVRRDWVQKLKSATLDDRIYVLTPQARVIELPSGATPVDFAYHLHSDVGHRCRGARVDGVMVPLNTPLKNGQTVEIITAKWRRCGPSRDWLGRATRPARGHAPRFAPGSMPSSSRRRCPWAAAWWKRPAARGQDGRQPRRAGPEAGLRQGR
jgi:GTP pyrophosphokinase